MTWFRVGGPAEVLFSPADEDDLAYFLADLPREIPVTVIGLGSNLIVRDGGVQGVVIRLGGEPLARSDRRRLSPTRRRGGAGHKLAKPRRDAGVDGLAFFAAFPARSAAPCA